MLRLRRKSRSGFTLLELIVVIVVLGLLAALAIPTFARVIERSRDEVAAASLSAVARDAQALAAFGGTFSYDSIATATGETALRASAQGAYAQNESFSLAPGSESVVPGGASEGSDLYGEVAWALSGASDRIGLAMKAPSGRCVYVMAENTAGTGWALSSTKPAFCDAGAALTIGVGANVPEPVTTGDGGSTGDGGGSAGDGGGTVTADWSGTLTQDKIWASDGQGEDYFGDATALSGDWALVQAGGAMAATGYWNGAAYFFHRDGGLWTQAQRIESDVTHSGVSYAAAVDMSGTLAFVGAPDRNGVSQVDIYALSSGTWTKTDTLTDPSGSVNTRFGASLAYDNGTLVIGAPYADSYNGKVYTYQVSGGVGTLQQSFNGADYPAAYQFGRSVDVSGTTFVVGSQSDPFNSSGPKGQVDVFTESGGVWTHQASPQPAELVNGDDYGFAVSIDGGTIAASSEKAVVDGADDAGAIYIWTGSGASWTQEAKLTITPQARTEFGYALKLQGDTLVASAEGENNYMGAAYVFSRTGGSWTQQARLQPSDIYIWGYYGQSVALDGNTIIIGAEGADGRANLQEGAGYIYTAN